MNFEFFLYLKPTMNNRKYYNYELWGIQLAGTFLITDGIIPRVTVINKTIVPDSSNKPS